MERIELARRLGVARRAVGPSANVDHRGTAAGQVHGGVSARPWRREARSSWRIRHGARRSGPQFCRPGRSAGCGSEAENSRIETSGIEHGWLCLPTGGSSGAWRLAAARSGHPGRRGAGLLRTFPGRRINAVGVLPLHHVSGLMAWMRCALTGGRYVPWDWTEMEAGRWPETGSGRLVPFPRADPAAAAARPTRRRRTACGGFGRFFSAAGRPGRICSTARLTRACRWRRGTE